MQGKDASFYRRRSCTQLPHTIVHLEERVRGGGPFSPDVVTLRTGAIPLSWASPAPHVTIAWRGWGAGEGCGGRGRSGGHLGTPRPLGAGQQPTAVSPSVPGPWPLSHPSHSFPGLDIVLCRNVHPSLGFRKLQAPCGPVPPAAALSPPPSAQQDGQSRAELSSPLSIPHLQTPPVTQTPKPGTVLRGSARRCALREGGLVPPGGPQRNPVLHQAPRTDCAAFTASPPGKESCSRTGLGPTFFWLICIFIPPNLAGTTLNFPPFGEQTMRLYKMSALKPRQMFISEVAGVVSPEQTPVAFLCLAGRCKGLLVLCVLKEPRAVPGSANAALLRD